MSVDGRVRLRLTGSGLMNTSCTAGGELGGDSIDCVPLMAGCENEWTVSEATRDERGRTRRTREAWTLRHHINKPQYHTKISSDKNQKL